MERSVIKSVALSLGGSDFYSIQSTSRSALAWREITHAKFGIQLLMFLQNALNHKSK
jgi:hypothetical protein